MQKFISWVKTHQAETALGAVAIVIVGLAAITTLSNSKPSLLGLKLRPMTQQAAYYCTNNLYCSDAEPVVRDLDIQAKFQNGKVGESYMTTVNTIGRSNYECTLTLAGVKPPVFGASLEPNHLSQSTQTGSKNSIIRSFGYVFYATPKQAGDYDVTITGVCNPLAGDGPSRFIEKTFQWKVLNPVTPPQGELDIKATFTEGTVGRDYMTNVTTVNGSTSGVYVCNLNLENVAPEVKTARLVPSPQLGGPVNREVRAEFRATPDRAGNYSVVLSASCNPRGDLKIKSIYVKKTFKWRVGNSPSADTATNKK